MKTIRSSISYDTIKIHSNIFRALFPILNANNMDNDGAYIVNTHMLQLQQYIDDITHNSMTTTSTSYANTFMLPTYFIENWPIDNISLKFIYVYTSDGQRVCLRNKYLNIESLRLVKSDDGTHYTTPATIDNIISIQRAFITPVDTDINLCNSMIYQLLYTFFVITGNVIVTDDGIVPAIDGIPIDNHISANTNNYVVSNLRGFMNVVDVYNMYGRDITSYLFNDPVFKETFNNLCVNDITSLIDYIKNYYIFNIILLTSQRDIMEQTLTMYKSGDISLINASDTGTGKTAICSCIAYLMCNRRIFLVCKSELFVQWDSWAKYLGLTIPYKYTYGIFSSGTIDNTPIIELNQSQTVTDPYYASYENTSGNYETTSGTYINRMRYDIKPNIKQYIMSGCLVVIDEVHKCKNETAACTNKLSVITRFIQTYSIIKTIKTREDAIQILHHNPDVFMLRMKLMEDKGISDDEITNTLANELSPLIFHQLLGPKINEPRIRHDFVKYLLQGRGIEFIHYLMGYNPPQNAVLSRICLLSATPSDKIPLGIILTLGYTLWNKYMYYIQRKEKNKKAQPHNIDGVITMKNYIKYMAKYKGDMELLDKVDEIDTSNLGSVKKSEIERVIFRLYKLYAYKYIITVDVETRKTLCNRHIVKTIISANMTLMMKFQELYNKLNILKDTKDGSNKDYEEIYKQLETNKINLTCGFINKKLAPNKLATGICFCRYRETQNKVYDLLTNKYGYRVAKVNGDVSQRDRMQIISAINNGAIDIIISTYGCFSEGINLQQPDGRDDRYIFMFPTYSIIQMMQAAGRNSRAPVKEAYSYIIFLMDKNGKIRENELHTKLMKKQQILEDVLSMERKLYNEEEHVVVNTVLN